MPRILLLNDEPMIRELMKVVLGSGHELLETGKSLEAISLLQREPVDLLVTDVEHGAVSGIELYKILKANKQLQHIPVLFVTASEWSELSSIHEDIHAFDDGYLEVPFLIEDLSAAVKAILARRHKRQPPQDSP